MRRHSLGSHVGVACADPVFFTHQNVPSIRTPVPPHLGASHRPTHGGCACARACACVPACLHACVPACLRACVPACVPARLCACVSACLRVCVPACSFGFRKHHHMKQYDCMLAFDEHITFVYCHVTGAPTRSQSVLSSEFYSYPLP